MFKEDPADGKYLPLSGGTITSIANLKYNTAQNEIISVRSRLFAASPLSRNAFHNHFAFLCSHILTDYKRMSLTGTKWVQQDDVSDLYPLFSGKTTPRTTILTENDQAMTFTIHSENFKYSLISWISISTAWSSAAPTVYMSIETNGVKKDWSYIAQDVALINTTYSFIPVETDKFTEMRFTFTRKPGSGTGEFIAIGLYGWTNRDGDQGLRIENELPFNYDQYGNIRPRRTQLGNVGAASLGVNGDEWKSLYARNIYGDSFSGNAASATKVGNSLTFNGKPFDGSSAVTIDSIDCGEF